MSLVNFGIRLSADAKSFVEGTRGAREEFDRLTSTVEKGAQRATGAAEKLNATLGRGTQQAIPNVDRLGGAITGLAKAGAAAFGVNEVLGYARALGDAADAASMIRSRLALVAGSAQNTAQVYGELFRIAQASRVGFEDLASTYAQIARSADESGISQDRMLRVTQALSQAITISGGSAASAQAAMVQLSQGLASGTLRGEELNSILEQTPRIAQAIAGGLGVGIGQLRKLGEEGRLTTDVVVGALERSAPAIAAEFQRMTPTIGQALTTLSNSGLNLVGVLDQMSGASSGVATAIGGMASAIDGFASAIKDNPIVMAYLEALKFAASGGPAGALYRYMNRDPNAETTASAAQSDALLGRRATEAAARANRRSQALSFATDKEVLSKDQRRIAEINELSGRYVSAVSKLGDTATESDLEKLRGALRQGIANIDAKYKDTAGASAAKAAATDRKQALVAQLADERAAVEFSERLKLSALESLGRQGVKTDEQVARERLAVQLASITQQEAIAQRALAAAGRDESERARATGAINALARERVQVEQETTQRLAELTAERARLADTEARAYRQARYDDIAALRESVRTMGEENVARQQAAAFGRDEAEVLRELRIARLEAELAVDERPDPEKLERIQLLREELRLLRERRQLSPVQDAATDQRSIAAREADAFRSREQDMTRSLTDALYRGFENGKGLAENFRDTLQNTIGTMVLRPLIEPVVRPVANLLSSGITALLNGAISASGYGFAGAAGAETIDSMMGSVPRRAKGGAVSPFGTYLVGEEGPELLRLGARGGSIVPNPATAARMGGGQIVVKQELHFDFTNSIGVRETVQAAAEQGAQQGAAIAQAEIAGHIRRGGKAYD